MVADVRAPPYLEFAECLTHHAKVFHDEFRGTVTSEARNNLVCYAAHEHLLTIEPEIS